jgi:hypothetical protein
MASWFRSWHGAPTDNKWLVIARRANVAPGVVSAVAWALMDYASQADERGSVDGFDIETYCAFSGFQEQDVTSILSAMHDKDIIGSDDRLTAWDKRQPKREDDSSDRVRDWRAKQRDEVTPPLQQPVTHGNAVKRTVTHGNNTDTDTDTESYTESETNHLAPAARDEDDIPEMTPDRRAIQNAYDASGLMLSKTHIDAHLETIRRTGIPAWQQGWAAAMAKGKQNLPAYVARCAESAMLAVQKGNGNGRVHPPTAETDLKAYYTPDEYADIIES